MEPCTQHGGVPAEQRCRYIFRFYSYIDNSNSFQLNLNDDSKEKDNNNSKDKERTPNLLSFDQFK
jgi:hypothetical protein